MRLGLERGTVKLAPFSDQWKQQFERERSLLCSTLQGISVAIEHIGSTAIPDMPAKPIIDVAVAVRTADDIQRCIQILQTVGYEYKGEYGLAGRHFFVRDNTHHLHVVVQGSEHWERWLLFRDYLKRNAESAERYAQLKQELAQKYAQDRDNYTKAKTDFISGTISKAHDEGFTHKQTHSC